MGRKGKTPKEPLQVEKLGDVLAGMTRALQAEPTTLCTEHIPNAERPLECAKCGKPLALVQREGERKFVLDATNAYGETLGDLIAETERLGLYAPGMRDKLKQIEADARQSEKRFEPDVPDPLWADNEWSDVDPASLPTEAEKDAPLCAVLTPNQLAAVLDADDETVERLLETEDAALLAAEAKAKDDGPAYEPRVATLVSFGKDGPKYEPLDPLWSMRLSILAKEDGLTECDYVTKLIRRQWVARGKGA
jgi:hypothetical protein